MAKQTLKVKQNPDKPIEKEVLAKVITRISESVTKLLASGINRKAIVALIQDDTRLSKREILIVLDSLSELKSKYCI